MQKFPITPTAIAVLLTSLSGCAFQSGTVTSPRALCTPQSSSGAVRVDFTMGTNVEGKEIVVVDPTKCAVVRASTVTFDPSTKLDKARVTFVSNGNDDACTVLEPGPSPFKGALPIITFPVTNGFVQARSLQVGNTAAGEYYYCVDAGVHPMPNPAIIIKE